MTVHPTELRQQQQQPTHPIPHGGSAHGARGVPPQGRRFQTNTSAPFPGVDITGPPPFRDVGGEPVFVGSSVSPGSVHPCKLVPHLRPVCRVAYGGGELEHQGRYDILPITQEHEWVPTSHGRVPEGRRPVDGGYEESGHRLYHAVAVVHGCSVPGKTGAHLGGAHVPFGGSEIIVAEGYWILCWRD